MSDAVIVLALALGFDLLLAEPPNAVHPVVWMGRYIAWGERHVPRGRPAMVFCYGVAWVSLGVIVAAGMAAGMGALLAMTPLALNRLAGAGPMLPAVPGPLADVPRVLSVLLSACLLKTTFAARALAVAARGVQRALERGDLPEARRLLSWHLVSRDTCTLDAGLVAAATVESVAENFSDSFVAPLLFFALFGLPGAVAYRFANTADAMLGYHDARREYLGKFAARLDDVLNVLPARMAALLLLLGAMLSGADTRSGWRVMWRDHARTASPNAGWPMSAMAGVLGLTLEKVGYYGLGDGAAPDANAIARSLRVAVVAGVVWVAVVAAWLWIRSY